MDRKDFFKRLIGITGLAIIAPSLLSKENYHKCPLCLDTGKVVVAKRGLIGGLKFPDKMGPCPNCFPEKKITLKLNDIERSVIQGKGMWVHPDEWLAEQLYMEHRKKSLYQFLKIFKA